MPGYTHLQKAQPVTFAHHLMAYFEMFKRDYARLQDCRERMNVMPLGFGRYGGNNLSAGPGVCSRGTGFSAQLP